MSRTHTCDRCDAPCREPEDEFEEFLCDECVDRMTERGRKLLNDTFFGSNLLGWLR